MPSVSVPLQLKIQTIMYVLTLNAFLRCGCPSCQSTKKCQRTK